MKKLYFLILVLGAFLIGCKSKDSVTEAVNETPTNTVTKKLSATYSEDDTKKSIFVGNVESDYAGNFKLTYTEGTTSSSFTATPDMIKMDTNTVGEKVATITYNNLTTTVSALVCTTTTAFEVSVNTITKYKGNDETVVVPKYIGGEAITTLGDKAFYDNDTIKNVIADNIVTLQNGLPFYPDYYGAFSNCINLTSISLVKVDSIGINAFYNCSSLESISVPLVTSIGKSSFSGCSNLESISIPLVTSIGESSFFGCSSLKNISIPLLTSIGNYSFYNCSNLESISIPLVTSIGQFSFSGCSSLKNISIPLLTSTGYASFEDCSSLANISLPVAETIGKYSFSGCSNLESISIPLVTTLIEGSFYNCSSLKSILIPLVTSVGRVSFSGCTSLTSITFGSITPPTLYDKVFSSGGTKTWNITVPESSRDAYIIALASATNTFTDTKPPTINGIAM